MKQEFNNINKFLKNNISLIIFSSLLMLILYGKFVFLNDIKIDTAIFVFDPISDYNWASIGRYGLLFLKKLLLLKSFNLYYAAGLFLFTLIITAIYWIYLMKKHIKYTNSIILISSLVLIFGSPIYTEQFYFLLQSVEIITAFLMTLISIDLTLSYLKTNKIAYAVVACLINIITFGVYQAFVPLYLSILIGFYLANYSNEFQKNSKQELIKFVKNISKLIAIFLISFIISTIISKSITTSSYLSNQIAWGKENLTTITNTIIGYIKQFICVKNIYSTYAYIFMIIALIIIQILINYKKNIMSLILNLVCLFIFAITPFLITIYTGNYQVNRAQLCFPVVVSLGLIIGYDKIKRIKLNDNIIKTASIIFTIIVIISALQEYKISSQLKYADEITYNQDQILANDIYNCVLEKIDSNIDNYRIIIIGKNPDKLPSSAIKGETMGISKFNYFSEIKPYYFYSTMNIQNIWKIIGKKPIMTDESLTDWALNYIKDNRVENFPNKNSIIIEDNKILVKISDDYINSK